MKIGFDYDGTISTEKGMELAKKHIQSGDTIYIISARAMKVGLLDVADKLNIPHSRVWATGSNKSKVEKVKSLGLDIFYDNNPDVINALPNIGRKF